MTNEELQTKYAELLADQCKRLDAFAKERLASGIEIQDLDPCFQPLIEQFKKEKMELLAQGKIE